MKNKDNEESIVLDLINLLNKILKKYKKEIRIKQINQPFYLNGLVDSLDFVNLIALIEKKYKFKFNISEIDVDVTIKHLSKLVLKKQ